MTTHVYTIAEICDLLKVHERTVYRWLKGGKLKGVKAGKLWRIPAASLNAFLSGEEGGEATLFPQTAADAPAAATPATAPQAVTPAEPDAHPLQDAPPQATGALMRKVTIRVEGITGAILFNEQDPSEFHVDLDHAARDKVLEHFIQQRVFKTQDSTEGGAAFIKARAVDNPKYFNLALCTLHVNTGVRVDW